MPYRYAENRNFEDYASGRVFYNRPGQPAFPVRLSSELFQRALKHWKAAGTHVRGTLYDPVCGGAYWLTVLAYLHWQDIACIYASEIDMEARTLAECNLALLTPAGLDQRICEIETMRTAYQKKSHTAALHSAKRFREQLAQNLKTHTIKTKVFQADATNTENMARGIEAQSVDLVLADIPYGWHSIWQTGHNDTLGLGQTPIWQMLEALQPLLKPGAVVTVAADKNQKIRHEKYQRLERFQLGKRRIFLLRPQS